MNGKRRIRFALLAALVLGACLPPAAMGQREERSVFDQKMQRRYMPADSSFRQRFFVSAMGGYRRWLDRGMSAGPTTGLAAGMWFTPLHGARIEAGTAFFLDNETGNSVKILPDVRASYLFNLSAFMNGYRPDGRGTLYTLLGGGYAWRLSAPETGGKSSWNMQLGMGYSFRVLRRVDLFVEPVFELNGNRFVQQRDDNWRGYNTGFRGTAGINYHLERRSDLSPWPEHDWYVTASGGISWQLLQVPRDGFSLRFGVGEYLSPATNVRLSASLTRNFKPGTLQNRSTYVALNLDGMVDLLSLGQDERRSWGLSLLAGPEVGGFSVNEPIVFGGTGRLGGMRLYVGMSAGVQLRARLYKRWDTFVESRTSLIPYAAKGKDGEGYNTLDMNLSANLGMLYNIRRHDERVAAWERVKQRTRDNWAYVQDRSQKNWDFVQRRSHENWDFVQRRSHENWQQFKERSRNNWQALYPRLNLFAGLEASYFRPLDRHLTNGPYVSLFLGGWFNGMNGGMLDAGLGYFQDLKYGNGYVKSAQFGGAYLFNISHFLHGADARWPFSLSLMAGAGYMLPIKERWKGSAVFRAGLDWRMHAFPRTSLVVRPEIDFLQLPSGQWGPALRGSMGLAYSLGGHPDAHFPDFGQEWYLALGGGYHRQLNGQAAGAFGFRAAVGRHYTPRLDWRVSLSFLSRTRLAALNVDALYNLLGDRLEDSRWSLSLLAGPELGVLRPESSKSWVPVYLGASAGIQAKYRFYRGLSVYLEPRYTLVTDAIHTFGAGIGLEYAFARDRYHQGGTVPDRQEEKGEGYPFVQGGATVFVPFGPGYANGPLVSMGGGYWFNGRHGAMLDAGIGYFRDNQYSRGADGRTYSPQHMATAEFRASYLYRFHRRVSLIAGAGWLIPEIKQRKNGSLTAHAGLDFRFPIAPPVDLVLQPQIEVFRDPHSILDGNPKAGLGGAFRGSFGLAYNITGNPPAPSWDPGRDWFVAVSAGLQNESGIYAEPAGTDFSYPEYRVALAVGKKLSPALSVRASASFSEIYPMEYTFRHNLRYTSLNLEMLYDLLGREDGGGRFSLSLLAGPEAGLFNKSDNAEGHERPLRVPLSFGKRSPRNIGAYLGGSAGMQAGVRLSGGLFLYVEPRYSLIPYVSVYSATDHRNMYSHLWSVNIGFQYFFRNLAR